MKFDIWDKNKSNKDILEQGKKIKYSFRNDYELLENKLTLEEDGETWKLELIFKRKSK